MSLLLLIAGGFAEDPDTRAYRAPRGISALYLQNLFEHHEDLETVRCVDGEQVASYRRDDVF